MLLATSLAAQQISENWLINGDFDKSIDGWTTVGAVSWDGGLGSPHAGAMRLVRFQSVSVQSHALQCFPAPLPTTAPYQLTARVLTASTPGTIMVESFGTPDCSGVAQEWVTAGSTGISGDWTLVQTPPVQFAAAPASVQVIVRPYLPGDMWVDHVKFGPLRAYQTVVAGPGNDYQASIAVPWGAPQARIGVFERLGAGNSGDLLVTRSDDDGNTWSAPMPVVATAANERHPALVQTAATAWSLFHLSNASGSFRIHRATSNDGMAFSPSSPIDLGWPAGNNQINPYVIREADGILTLTYHLLNGASFIARSVDDGANWDTLQTQVSPGTAALPRIAHRASDDTWLLVYQTGSAPVTLWVKTTKDPYDWSAPARQLVPDGNNHDAFPVVLADDSFAIAWARVANGAFQIFSARSFDGITWETPLQHSDRADLANIQPYTLPGPAPGTLELYWGAAQVPNDSNYDIVRIPAATVVGDLLFASGFETP